MATALRNQKFAMASSTVLTVLMKTAAALTVVNPMSSSVSTKNAFSKLGDAMVKTIVEMVLTKRVAALLLHLLAYVVTKNSNALTDSVFQNRSNVTLNQIVVTSQTKLDVSHLL